MIAQTSMVRTTSLLLVKLRAFYLATGLAGGLLNPYMSTIFVESGWNRNDVGIIMSISSFLIIFAQLMWGRIADRYRLTRTILLLSLAVPAAVALLYPVASMPVLVAAYFVVILFTSPQAPISDAYAVAAARAAGSSYGTIRSFQSVGNALGGYLAGMLVATYAPHTLVWPFFAFGCLGVAVVLAFPKETEVAFTGRSFLSGIGDLLRDMKVVLFLIACLLINQTLTAFNTYFVVVFQMSGGSYEQSGLALMIAALSNVPSMFLASRVIGKLGMERTMMLAAAAYVLRWAIQYVLPIPSVMVGVQALQGLSFGLFYVAAVEYVGSLVSRDLQATGQSVFNVVFVGAAGIAGNLTNGFLLEAGGPAAMNLACMVSAACGAMLLLVIVKRSGTSSRTQSRLNA
ncbi:PPP family 3-phenylpropionic acid transporter [Paenibacillus phyllosphaerae]|uniref:PPP family 3-phenylpropionic acid transporter n=1 Tax=Paenibacillus phyllosphaerae TaxID=274593 RepID=A0A7W5B0U8_9BACL|nr:MFS transporter [Paenibacillus phyllosphaerae]MBB3111636.1 PPP family 3-phenylpropionic acid transporter [Paenibacillus phyllosphaerae]